MSYQWKIVSRDGKPQRKFKCPRCGSWADIDDDQFFGRVSMECPVMGCDFHETIDLSRTPDRI